MVFASKGGGGEGEEEAETMNINIKDYMGRPRKF